MAAKDNAASAKPTYLSSLQIFRGVAALGVILYHGDLFCQRQLHQTFLGGVFRYGELGVDFFFVLSGFIITMVHWDDVGHPERAPKYLQRRFWRIYPILFLLTTVKFIAILINPALAVPEFDSSQIMASFLLLPIFDNIMPIIASAWTLSHEALFYGIFLIVLIMGKRAAWIILGGWAFAMTTCHLCGIWMDGTVRFVFDAHNIEFLIGVATCLFLRRDIKGESIKWGMLVICALVLLIIGGLRLTPSDGKDQVFAVRLALGTAFALLIAFAVIKEKTGSWKKSPRWLTWLGDASYSIYLGHPFVLLAVISVLPRWLGKSAHTAQFIVLIGVAASLFACGLLWRFAERPLLQWSKRWTR